MTAPVGLFYGSDTGNTETVAKKIQAELGKNLVELHDIRKAKKEDFDPYDFLILGCPTWYQGELQSDWDAFFPQFQELNLDGKIVAIFGCGDQEDYTDYFVNAMGTIRDAVLKDKGVIVGSWPTEGYSFEQSTAVDDDGHFVGLAIDEDRQPEKTDERIKKWCTQLREEMCLDQLV